MRLWLFMGLNLKRNSWWEKKWKNWTRNPPPTYFEVLAVSIPTDNSTLIAFPLRYFYFLLFHLFSTKFFFDNKSYLIVLIEFTHSLITFSIMFIMKILLIWLYTSMILVYSLSFSLGRGREIQREAKRVRKVEKN